MLIVGEDGIVRHANTAAEHLLGPAAGRRCDDVIKAYDAHGVRVVSVPSRAGHPVSRDRCVSVRLHGERWNLATSAMGREYVIALVHADSPESVVADQLTPREQEVMTWVARGANTAIIARQLGLAEATVRTHVEHVRQKLGVRTRAEAVARLLGDGAVAAK